MKMQARVLDWEYRRARYNTDTLNMAIRALQWALADVLALDGEVQAKKEMEAMIRAVLSAANRSAVQVGNDLANLQAVADASLKH